MMHRTAMKPVGLLLAAVCAARSVPGAGDSRGASEPSIPPIATVAGRSIPANRIAGIVRRAQAKNPSEAQLLAAIEQEARRQRIAIDARRRKLNEQADVREKVAAYRLKLLANVAKNVAAYDDQLLVRTVYEQAEESAGIADTDVKSYYSEHASEFVEPAGKRLRLIRCATQDQANAVLGRLKKGEDFDKLAQETKSPRNGEVGRMTDKRIARLPKDVQAAVRGLKVGQTAGPVRMGNSYDILKAVESRSARQRPLEEVKDEIRRLLVRQARDAAMEKLSAKLEKEFPTKVNQEEVQKLVAANAAEGGQGKDKACGCSARAGGCGSGGAKRGGCGSPGGAKSGGCGSGGGGCGGCGK